MEETLVRGDLTDDYIIIFCPTLMLYIPKTENIKLVLHKLIINFFLVAWTGFDVNWMDVKSVKANFDA